MNPNTAEQIKEIKKEFMEKYCVGVYMEVEPLSTEQYLEEIWSFIESKLTKLITQKQKQKEAVEGFAKAVYEAEDALHLDAKYSKPIILRLAKGYLRQLENEGKGER